MNYSLSVIIGGLVAIMILFNGTLSVYLGNYGSIMVIHFVGLIGMIFLLLFYKKSLKNTLKYSYLLYMGGAVGIFTVIFSNISFVKIGASLTLAVSLFSQTTLSVLLDHYGIGNREKVIVNKKKFIGFFLIVIGIIIMAIY
jgi:transporter family-2 protein